METIREGVLVIGIHFLTLWLVVCDRRLPWREAGVFRLRHGDRASDSSLAGSLCLDEPCSLVTFSVLNRYFRFCLV